MFGGGGRGWQQCSVQCVGILLYMNSLCCAYPRCITHCTFVSTHSLTHSRSHTYTHSSERNELSHVNTQTLAALACDRQKELFRPITGAALEVELKIRSLFHPIFLRALRAYKHMHTRTHTVDMAARPYIKHSAEFTHLRAYSAASAESFTWPPPPPPPTQQQQQRYESRGDLYA